jgi:hypothetical protein
VEHVVESWRRDFFPIAINYRRNSDRLGFQRNLEAVLRESTGDITVVLGDDDMFATPGALAAYVAAAERHPGAAFLYPNLIQIDEQCNRTAVHRYFRAQTYYAAGADSLAGPWLRSVQIAGMGFCVPATMVAGLLPTVPSLFPQVAAVGQLLLTHGSVGMNDYLVATRVTGSQLGYEVAQGRSVFGDRQRLGGVELLEILAEMRSRAPTVLEPVKAGLERRIFVGFLLSEPNIRVFSGRRALARLARSYATHSWQARRSPVFWMVTVGLWVAPVWYVRLAIAILKIGARRLRKVDAVPFVAPPHSRTSWLDADLDRGQRGCAGPLRQ